MKIDLVRRLIAFFVLLVAQVLILNHIHLFDMATPLLYVYFVITFHRNMPKWMILVWSFVLGLLVDIFSNTPGLAAGCITMIAFVQPYLLELLVPRDSVEDLESSVRTLGFTKFLVLSAVLTVVYCLLFFALEAFSFFNWLLWLERAIASAVLTLVLIFAIESIRSK